MELAKKFQPQIAYVRNRLTPPVFENFLSHGGQGIDFSVRTFFLGVTPVGDQSFLLEPGQEGVDLAEAQGPDSPQARGKILIKVVSVGRSFLQGAQNGIFRRVAIPFGPGFIFNRNIHDVNISL